MRFHFHRWKIVGSTGKWRYRECQTCGVRIATLNFNGGYQPIKGSWLDGGVWETTVNDPSRKS